MKSFYTSKTLWVNILSIVGVFVANKYGYTLTAEQTTLILGLINMILRAITNEKLTW